MVPNKGWVEEYLYGLSQVVHGPIVGVQPSRLRCHSGTVDYETMDSPEDQGTEDVDRRILDPLVTEIRYFALGSRTTRH